MFNYDEVLDEIGEFGVFQFTNYILIALPLFFSAGNSLTYVFTAGIPNYRFVFSKLGVNYHGAWRKCTYLLLINK